MKKFILSTALFALCQTSSAAVLYGVTPTLVGSASNGTEIYVGLADNSIGCHNGGMYFTETEKKTALSVAIAAKLAAKTVRIDYTQPSGPGTKCLAYSIYLE